MIQLNTYLKSMDNSGARYVKCIKCLNGFSRTYSYSGDFILVSIKTLRFQRRVKTKEIHLALVTRTKKKTTFKDGSSSGFSSNYVILFSSSNKRFLGTRLYGVISRSLRKQKFIRIILLSGKII